MVADDNEHSAYLNTNWNKIKYKTYTQQGMNRWQGRYENSYRKWDHLLTQLGVIEELEIRND